MLAAGIVLGEGAAAPRRTARTSAPPRASFSVKKEEPSFPTTLVFPPFGHTYGFQKATPFKLRLFVGSRAHFRNPQGIAAVRLDAWDDPTTTKDDDELTVFGVNSGEGSILYNRSLKSLDVYGARGSGKDRFLDPEGIAADPAGNVYVADTGNRRIVHLVMNDDRLHWISAADGSGAGLPALARPRQIAIGPGGNLYVTDPVRNEVRILDPSGKAVGNLPVRRTTRGAWEGPVGIAARRADERWSYRKGDMIYVADRGGTRLTKLGPSGIVEAEAGAASVPIAGARFDWLALDYYGNLYATDTKGCVIHKFDGDLRYLVSFGAPGTRERQFRGPTGIAIWRRFGQTFVAEATGAQYYWVGTDWRKTTELPRLRMPRKDVLELALFLTERSSVDVRVTDAHDNVLGQEVELDHAGSASVAVRLSRAVVPGEVLRVAVTLSATYSSKTHFEKKLELAYSP